MLKAYCFIGDRQAAVRRRDDSRLVLDLDDVGMLNFILSDEYEADVSFALKAFGARGSVIIDVGANLGIHTVALLRALERDCTIHAFEPNPHVFGLLRKNVILNGGGDCVRTHQAAAWHETGTGRFSFRREQHRVGAVAVEGGMNYGDVEHEVRLVRIDDLMKANPATVSVIKIDVEGREPFVIEGARKTIAASRCAVVHEYHPEVIESVYGVARYRALVADLGYRTFAIDVRRKEIVPIGDLPDGHSNIVIAP